MSGLDNIISVTLNIADQSVLQEGYGTPLICTYHTRYTNERVREYTSLSGMVSDGFTTTDNAYMIASVIFSQSPRVESIKIGRRALNFTQTIRITPTAANTTVYSIDVQGETATFTSDGSATVAEITAGLTSAINALSVGVTATDNTTHVTCVASAGVLRSYAEWTSLLAVEDVTTDPGIATDLAAILVEDADWYGLVLDSNSKAEVSAAASWAESNKKLFFYDAAGSAVFDAESTSDILSVCQTAGYNRSVGVARKTIGKTWAGAGWAGVGLPYLPGQITWAHKQIAAVDTEQYTDTEIATVVAKGGNYYMNRFAVGDILEGWAASGRYIDITHGADWLVSRMQEYIYGLLVSTKKIPFTDAGIGLIEGKIREVLNLAIQNQYLAATPVPTVVMPRAADVSAQDKAARTLTGVVIGATLAGAIHRIEIDATLSV